MSNVISKRSFLFGKVPSFYSLWILRYRESHSLNNRPTEKSLLHEKGRSSRYCQVIIWFILASPTRNLAKKSHILYSLEMDRWHDLAWRVWLLMQSCMYQTHTTRRRYKETLHRCIGVELHLVRSHFRFLSHNYFKPAMWLADAKLQYELMNVRVKYET